MARLLTITPNKTYASEANAVKAVEKVAPAADNDGMMYFIQRTPEGRFFPVFFGNLAVAQRMFTHFNVVA